MSQELKSIRRPVFAGILIVASCPFLLHGQDAVSQRPFEVRDSIEMKVFSDPYTRTVEGTAKTAPDGSGYVVVTTQGRVDSNTLESDLWYFSKEAIVKFLNGERDETPHPRLLFRKTGIPQAEQLIAYGSLITNVQWFPDSRRIAFLVEGSNGKHHLFEESISPARAIDMTPNERGEVSAPKLHGASALYLASLPLQRPPSDPTVTSTVLTGQSLPHILFPDQFPDKTNDGVLWKLRVSTRGRSLSFPLKDSEGFPAAAVPLFQPEISPDGSYAITVVPVAEVPQSWVAYQSANATLGFYPSTHASDQARSDVLWPWHYALIDLRTGTMRSLVDTPTGFTTAWANPYQAKWSHAGDAVLVTNTYLPLEAGREYKKNSIAPCAIAEYSLKTRITRCIASTPPLGQGEHLLSADYNTADHITAHWLVRGKSMIRTYAGDSDADVDTKQPTIAATSIELYVRQDIDVPPTLWARQGSKNKLIWDPNPQLRHLELAKASAYEWEDSNSHKWRGGLVLPPRPKPQSGYPLVIQTHGFYNDHEFLVDGAYTSGFAAQALACDGIAVLQIEDRSDKRSRPPEMEANDAVNGIESAIDHLSTEGLIDVHRIGILGFSRTHWYVEKALEHAPERYKAAVLVDGVDQSYVTDVLFGASSFISRQEHNGANGAPPIGQGLSQWLVNAVGFNLDKVTTPIRLVAIGAVSVLGEWETYSMLQQQAKPVELVEIPDGQHILQKPRERYDCQQGTVDWFRFWLMGYERQDPEDKAQYLRWEHMRSSSQH